MDISGNDDTNVDPQKAPNIIMSSQWQLNAPPLIDSFCPNIFGQGQNLGFHDVNAPTNDASTSSSFVPVRTDVFWTPNASNVFSPHLPADSGFIERAARFSCFNGGNPGDVLSGFHNIPYPQRLQGSKEASFGGGNNAFDSLPGIRNQKPEAAYNEPTQPGKNDDDDKHEEANESGEKGFNGCGDEEEMQGESSSKGREKNAKRKRTVQETEREEENRGAMQRRSIEAADDKQQQRGKNSKAGSQGSEPPKEGYIHIRARRGQATNSHSLAERVRREKISERMKFLQDLVPGCSKVTGKAVMLDEIINYVQSLQRQVEFLSMKLATVNPRLDFNLETLLAKDMLPPSSLAFPPNMHLPFPPLLHHSQPSGIGGLCSNSSETLRRPSNFLPTPSGFKESMSKVPNAWEDELHNVVHMGFDSSSTNPPLNSQQDLSGSVPSSSMKAEHS